MNTYVALENRALIAVRGPDARAFLQGLVTVEVLKLTAEKPRYAALLSPQGKFLHDFFLIAEGDTILIDTPKAGLADLSARLLRYRLRSQVKIDPFPEWSVFALLNAAQNPPPGLRLFADPRYAPMGMRLYGPKENCISWLQTQGFSPAATEAYEAQRIRFGIPDSAHDLIVDRSFIVECGFEQLNGVDFDKGCYVGQELTARTKYRANIRKQFYLIEGEGKLPAPGTAVTAGGREAGEIRSVFASSGIAMLYTEIVQGGENLKADNVFLRASLPPWVQAKSTGENSASGV